MYDVVAIGELLIDFIQNGVSGQGNPLFEANPGELPAMLLPCWKNKGIGQHLLEKLEMTF